MASQGFHDICQVVLLVLGSERAVPALEYIALLRIRDFMLPSMMPAIDHLRLLYPLLQAADPKLCTHLSRTQPFFALAATLTLYAHDIQEYGDIARLFDVFLAMDPVFPVYLFAQVRTSDLPYRHNADFRRSYLDEKKNFSKSLTMSQKCSTPSSPSFPNLST
jgi:hypothetical protein